MEDRKNVFVKPMGSMIPIENDSRAERRDRIRESLVGINRSLEDKSIGIQCQESTKGGIPLLYDDNMIYVDASDSHSLIIGATGSKKTRLLVLPLVHILGYTGESMIITDPKAEVYNRTAMMLKKNGYEVTVLNFRNPSTGSCWNPLAIPFELYKSGNCDRAHEFVNDIALNLMLAEKSTKDVFWDYSASDLLFGLILLLFKMHKSDEMVCLYDVLKLRTELFDKGGSVSEEIWEMAKNDMLISHSLMGTIIAPERTRSSILSTFDQKMRCFVYQDNLVKMMSSNTISMDSVGKIKSAIYLIMPDEKTTYHRLISLFVKQSYEYLIYQAQKLISGSFDRRINYILDEFSTLPTIKDFPAMITAARSRNIRFNLCIQSQQQLVYRYQEEAETIKSNCNNWIFLTSRELKLLQEISSLAGTDSSGKAVISVSALQHLDKDRGQVFILCGRLFPFVAELADISEFDHEKYEILKLEDREKPKAEKTEYANNIQKNIEKETLITKSDSEVISDELQRELEKKFDEIFGPIDDELEYPEEMVKETIDNQADILNENESSDEEYLDNVITLNDEEGNEVLFEFLDLVEYENEEYVVLLPTEESDSIGEVVILKVEENENDDEESYVSVDNEETLEIVFGMFKQKFKDEFDFIDEQDI